MFRFPSNLVVLLLLAFTVYFVIEFPTKNHFAKNNEARLDNNITVKLLLWTQFFFKLWHRNRNEVWEIKCGNAVIKVYQDETQVNIEEMDAILFHLSDTIPLLMPKKHYNRNQKWILYNLEAPPSLCRIFKQYTLRTIQGKIDWVMSYRHDSDIFVPYGFSYKTNEEFIENETHRIPTKLAKNQRYVYGYLKKNVISDKVGTLKGKQVAWLVSRCEADSNRQGFVKELSKYIKVDIYGKCGQQCPNDVYCRRFIAEEYNFYLSFENSLCKDYVTEKLFEALRWGILPIVFGGANYSQILPPKSFIDALSFKTPKQLANYLLQVSHNQHLYASYFEWRKSYKIFSRWHETAMCSVYDAIRENRKSRSDHNVFKWFEDDSKCWQWAMQEPL